MRFVDSVEIGLPREEVVRLFSDPDLLPMWLRGLVRQEPVSGVHGEVGSVSRFVFRQGGREMEALETVTVREPADVSEISGGDEVIFVRALVADGMRSVTRDRIIELNHRRTRWESRSEYTFDSLVMRVVAPVMRGSFQKQTRQHIQDFKAFAEHGVDVRASES